MSCIVSDVWLRFVNRFIKENNNSNNNNNNKFKTGNDEVALRRRDRQRGYVTGLKVCV